MFQRNREIVAAIQIEAYVNDLDPRTEQLIGSKGWFEQVRKPAEKPAGQAAVGKLYRKDTVHALPRRVAADRETLRRSFQPKDREQLVGIVDDYFGMQPFEGAAPFADDAQAYLKNVRAKANAFSRCLVPPPSRREAAFFVQRLITQRFHGGQQSGPDKWDEVIHFISAFEAASRLAAEELPKHVEGRGFVEGYAWRGLIRELDRFCRERSLRVGASKGSNKSRRREPSPFVAFVYELQRAFPDKFRRHNFSHEALAKAIATARRAPARDRKSGEAKS